MADADEFDLPRQLGIEGEFTINVPADAELRTEDDGCLVVIRLNTAEATEILIARYPFEGERDRPFKERLMEKTVEFMHCVPKSTPMATLQVVEVEDSWCSCHARSEGEPITIARIYASEASESFVLIHWTGALRDEPLACAIFNTFNPVMQ